MFCPHCGNEAPNTAVVCPTCGVNMQEYFKADNVSSSKQANVNDEAVGMSEPKNQTKPLHKQAHWQAFVDSRYHFYDQKWSMSSQPDMKVGWNWASFFVGLFWLGYRKMYREVLILIGLFFLIDFVIAMTGIYVLHILLPFVIYFYLGMKGNALYYQHVRKKLAELQYDHLSMEAYREHGGVSGTGVVVTILLLFAYAGISTVIFGF